MCYTLVTVFAATVQACHSTTMWMSLVPVSITSSLILVKCPLYNFVPRDVCIFEKVNTTAGNQIVGFNSHFERKTPVCNIES